MAGLTAVEQFRQDLIDALRRELVGPDLPPTGTQIDPAKPYQEILQESPSQRYSAGVLFPQSQPITEIDDASDGEDKEPIENADDGNVQLLETEESVGKEPERSGSGAEQLADAYDETVRMANEYFPSAIGMSFLCDSANHPLVISVTASTYESKPPSDPKSKLREWKRNTLDIKPVRLKLDSALPFDLQEFEAASYLCLRAIYKKREDGTYLVTVSLFNKRLGASDKPPKGSDCFFQVGFDVAAEHKGFVFPEYKVNKTVGSNLDTIEKQEDACLALLYRNRHAYAVGHGCSVDWGDDENGRVNKLETVAVPQFKVPPVEPRSEGGDELSMYVLAGKDRPLSGDDLAKLLSKLPQDYESWIIEQSNEVRHLDEDLQASAKHNLQGCGECLSRIRLGIEILQANDKLRTAFTLANEAMLMQQYHSRREKRAVDSEWIEMTKDYKPSDNRSGRWRTFQLAFVLMNLPSLVADSSEEHTSQRDLVDLIWFPTGGGKTEAYLGLAACDILYRRLCNPANAGCTVLMRYTLRLLTSQQFQRASSLICACEKIRRRTPQTLGIEPISIGLWVGESLTPTYRANALKAVSKLGQQSSQAENPFQLLKCPWCGTALDDKNNLGYVAHGTPKTVIFVCPERSRCEFASRETRLPVSVIDEDIYASPPTLIIGTVDKFAMLAWREQAGKIFGIGVAGDVDPPDLIIQDELHLISGPLGSVVGLYEAAIDALCSWKGKRPKIVASTATIRRAAQQCKALYDREVFQFPPQGIDISDSFFAKENPDAPGRYYVGVFASAAPSFVTAMVRAIGSLMQSAKSLPLPAGADESIRDPYWTSLQYFNSLRELGHAATLVEADIPEYIWAIASRSKLPRELCRSVASPVELTSRRTADEIPEILERLSVRYPRVSEDSDSRPLDTLLATNMISVGVDVDRLGLMVVVGQPKTTAEYIQASSRVGRSNKAPGLVIAMYNPGKPRDRSHYEHFRAYHAAFYKHVEPTSVTPYSLPVLERALHAVLVVLARHLGGVTQPQNLNIEQDDIKRLVKFIGSRCGRIDSEHLTDVERRLASLLQHWRTVLPHHWGQFGDPPGQRPLMYPAGTEPLEEWDGSPWATPSSMRNVDVECEARVIAIYPEVETEGAM